MKVSAYTTLILFCLSCVNEIDTTSLKEADTIYITQIDTVAIIDGTHMLPNSRKTSISCEVMAVWLDSVTVEPCNSLQEPNFENDDWEFVQDSEDKFHIEVSAHAVCGSDFLFELQMEKDNNLDLKFYEYNSRADCYCCYGFNYYFSDNRNKYEDEDWFVPIKSISFNGKIKKPLSN